MIARKALLVVLGVVVVVVVVVVLAGVLGGIALTGGAGNGSGSGGGAGNGSGSSSTTSFTLPSPPKASKREVKVAVVSGSGNLHIVYTASGRCSGTFITDVSLTIPPTSVMPGTVAAGGVANMNVSEQSTWQGPASFTCNFGYGPVSMASPMPPHLQRVPATMTMTFGTPTSIQVSASGALASQNALNAGCSAIMATSHGHITTCNATLQAAYTAPQGLSAGTGKLKCTPSSIGQTAVPQASAPPVSTTQISCKLSTPGTYTGTLELANHPCLDFMLLPGATMSCEDVGSVSLKVKVEKRKYLSDPVLTPGQFNFAQQADGTASKAVTFTVTNLPAATAPLQVVAVGITGSAHPKFPIDADHCTGATLQPGQSCTFAVIFKPGSSDHGYEDATLKVITDAKVGTYTSALYGTAVSVPAKSS